MLPLCNRMFYYHMHILKLYYIVHITLLCVNNKRVKVIIYYLYLHFTFPSQPTIHVFTILLIKRADQPRMLHAQ
jgi:hypothetical protein